MTNTTPTSYNFEGNNNNKTGNIGSFNLTEQNDMRQRFISKNNHGVQQGNNNHQTNDFSNAKQNNTKNQQISSGDGSINSLVDNKKANQQGATLVNQPGSHNTANINQIIDSHIPKSFIDKSEIAPEVLLEKITYAENTLLPVSFLSKGLKVQRAVCRIIDLYEKAIGTGFLIGKEYVITNEHVVGNNPKLFIYEFNYNDGEQSIKCPPYDTATDHYVCKILDFALVRVNTKALKNIEPLQISKNIEPKENQRCNIIGHPKGKPKKVSLQKNVIVKVSKETSTIRYTTDTQSGSSGSPVFDNDWQVIALHHAYAESEKRDGKKVWLNNEGILIGAIVDDVRKNFNDRLNLDKTSDSNTKWKFDKILLLSFGIVCIIAIFVKFLLF